MLDDTAEGIIFELYSLIQGGLLQGNSGGIVRQRAYFRKVEQPLGIRLGLSHTSAQLG